ncbi:hypothetical protein, partial [Klebsiella pneumoniae]|uniref:hypothetical protein n=1 Tax=Klebsiella pneumoniae TaxID=573 RepID=UPI001C4EE137
KRNMGFSYGNNRLIINCKYDNVLLLNPDVFDITNSFWGELTLNYNKQDVLFIKLLNEDGTFQDCIGKYASFSRAFGAKVDYEAINQATPIDNVLLLNPDVFDITNSFWGELTLNYNKQDVLFIKLLNEDGTFQDCIGKYASFSRAFGAKVDYEAINRCV